jgi:phage tail sheath protein FI
METLHPGVYVQEVSSGIRPIEGVSTSTAAFLGKAEKGPLHPAQQVTSFSEFQAAYGGFLNDSYLAHAALQFFNNGGKRLYVVRVAHNPAIAALVLNDRQSTPAKTLTISAINEGEWGNDLDIDIADGTRDPANEFLLRVKRAGVILETFDDLSMDPDATRFVDKVIGAGSQYIAATADPANDSTTAGNSVSGASPATSLSPGQRDLRITIDGDGPHPITLAAPTTTIAEIASAIQNAVRAVTPFRSSTAASAFALFTAATTGGVYTLTSGNNASGKVSSVEVDPSAVAAVLLKLGVANGGTETGGSAVLRPVVGSDYRVGDATTGGAVASVTAGSDGTTPQDADYMTAFGTLDPVSVNIVAVPGIGSKAVVDWGTNYCAQRQDCFFIGDMAASDDTPAEAVTFLNALTVKRSYGAVYFPWVLATDPTGASVDPIRLPPSGYVAGMYAQIDGRRGVWKAPAGTEANLGGATGLAVEITDTQQDGLNPIGVNVIRRFPASGIVIWGARTLATASDPEYLYVPVRRTAIFLEQSILRGIQYAVFEPNDEDLWASLRLNIGAFMLRLFRASAFQGSSPAKAFFVKCDGQTTSQADIDAGVVNIIVGFAPLKPAEFVVLQITQMAGQPS